MNSGVWGGGECPPSWYWRAKEIGLLAECLQLVREKRLS